MSYILKAVTTIFIGAKISLYDAMTNHVQCTINIELSDSFPREDLLSKTPDDCTRVIRTHYNKSGAMLAEW